MFPLGELKFKSSSNATNRPRVRTTASPKDIAGMVRWVKEAAGPRFDDLELNTYPAFRPASVTNEPRKAAEELLRKIDEREPSGLTVDELLESPHVFIGTVDELVTKFALLRDELGISNVMVGSGLDDFAPIVERLAGR